MESKCNALLIVTTSCLLYAIKLEITKYPSESLNKFRLLTMKKENYHIYNCWKCSLLPVPDNVWFPHSMVHLLWSGNTGVKLWCGVKLWWTLWTWFCSCYCFHRKRMVDTDLHNTQALSSFIFWQIFAGDSSLKDDWSSEWIPPSAVSDWRSLVPPVWAQLQPIPFGFFVGLDCPIIRCSQQHNAPEIQPRGACAGLFISGCCACLEWRSGLSGQILRLQLQCRNSNWAAHSSCPMRGVLSRCQCDHLG